MNIKTKLKRLRIEEERLLKRLVLKKLEFEISKVVFLDSSYFRDKIISCFLFYSFKEKRVINKKYIINRVNFPYIPTYFSLREAPFYIKGLKGESYDLIIVDGVGIAHPRRCGIATYLGIKLKKPSIGVSKNLLYGSYENLGIKKGDYSLIYDDKGDKIGFALRTKEKTKPIFVSPGNLITLEDALQITLSLPLKYRLPEPLREVDIYSKEIKRSLIENIHNR